MILPRLSPSMLLGELLKILMEAFRLIEAADDKNLKRGQTIELGDGALILKDTTNGDRYALTVVAGVLTPPLPAAADGLAEVAVLERLATEAAPAAAALPVDRTVFKSPSPAPRRPDPRPFLPASPATNSALCHGGRQTMPPALHPS